MVPFRCLLLDSLRNYVSFPIVDHAAIVAIDLCYKINIIISASLMQRHNTIL